MYASKFTYTFEYDEYNTYPYTQPPFSERVSQSDLTLAYGNRAVPRLLELILLSDAPISRKADAAELLHSVLSDPHAVNAAPGVGNAVLRAVARTLELPSSPDHDRLVMFLLASFARFITTHGSRTLPSLAAPLPPTTRPALPPAPAPLPPPSEADLSVPPSDSCDIALVAWILRTALARGAGAAAGAALAASAITTVCGPSAVVRLHLTAILLSAPVLEGSDSAIGDYDLHLRHAAAAAAAAAATHPSGPPQLFACKAIPFLLEYISLPEMAQAASAALASLALHPYAPRLLTEKDALEQVLAVLMDRGARTQVRRALADVLCSLALAPESHLLLPLVHQLVSTACHELDNDRVLFASLCSLLRLISQASPEGAEVVEMSVATKPVLRARVVDGL